MHLDPSESINNMGKLKVDVLDGSDLPSADRNGKSDPYCKFELNGQEVFKTKVQKKTLQPVWNEFFEVSVPSRTAAKMRFDVYDYDFADKPDFLGAAEINLATLDPFQASEMKYILDGKSGMVRLRLLFRPDYVTRARQGTSSFGGTFSAPGRVITGVAGAPLKGASVVGHGVGRGASFLKRGIFGKSDAGSDANGSMTEISEYPTQTSTDPDSSAQRDGSSIPKDRPTTSNGANGHNRTKSFGASSQHSTVPAGLAPGGAATLTVVGATGFPPSSDLYIVISQLGAKEKVVGKTKHHKSSNGQWTFEETFKATCSADAQFKVEAKGEHTFGRDDDLGEHVYFVDDSGSGGSKDLSIGGGTVTVKSSFQHAESSFGSDSPKTNVRRSFLSKREGRNSRESTPV